MIGIFPIFWVRLSQHFDIQLKSNAEHKYFSSSYFYSHLLGTSNKSLAKSIVSLCSDRFCSLKCTSTTMEVPSRRKEKDEFDGLISNLPSLSFLETIFKASWHKRNVSLYFWAHHCKIMIEEIRNYLGITD